MSRGRDAAAAGRPAWDDASLLADRAGVRWWSAVLLALGLSAIGVFADLQRIDRLGLVFQACYFAGCLLAVCLVQRRGLFGPMVQPPLLLALAVPGVVLLAGGAPDSGGLTSTALAVGTPLINGFPTMAITTGATLALGAFRLVTQRGPVAEPWRRGAPDGDRLDDGLDDGLDDDVDDRLDDRRLDEVDDLADGDGDPPDQSDGRGPNGWRRGVDPRRSGAANSTRGAARLQRATGAGWDTGDVADPDDAAPVRARRRRP